MTDTRKTIPRALLVDSLNRALATSGEYSLTADQRRTLASFVDGVLSDARTYRGFNYQQSEFNPNTPDGQFAGLRADYDDTRRLYY